MKLILVCMLTATGLFGAFTSAFGPALSRTISGAVDSEAGDLRLAEFRALSPLAVDFDGASFPRMGTKDEHTYSKIVFSAASAVKTDLTVRFNAVNGNWWHIVESADLASSGKQSILLRGIPAVRDDLYITFSKPMEAVGFVINNIAEESGARVSFYSDRDGRKLEKELSIPGKVNDDGLGIRAFVSCRSAAGIMRIGFDFQKGNANKISNRTLDDLSFVLLKTPPAGVMAENHVYPEPIASWDETEKERQRMAAESMHAALQKAIQEGKDRFVIAPGNYRLGTYELPNIVITATNFSIIADGAQFWIHGRKRYDAFLFEKCMNVSFRGAVIDTDPFHNSQGEVIAIDTAAKTFDVRIDPGFPLVDGWVKRVGDIKAVFISPDDRMREQRMDWVKQIDPIGERIYRITPRDGAMFNYDIGAAHKGDRFVFPDRTMRMVFNLNGCGSVSLENITIYGAPHMAVTEAGGEGGNSYRGIKVVRRPGTKRKIVCNADIFHSIKVKRGPRIENCEFSWSCDDAVNIHSFFSVVMEPMGETKARVMSFFTDDIGEGAKLEFARLPGMDIVGRAVVQADTIETDEKLIAEAKAIPKALADKGYKVGAFTGNGYFVHTVEFDRPLVLMKYDYIISQERIAQGTTVVSNFIHDIWTRGVLVKAVDFSIEHNRIERTGLTPMLIAPDVYFWESPFPRRGRIADNTIIDGAFALSSRLYHNGMHAALAAFTDGPGYRFVTNGIHLADIVIENNTIIRPSSTGVFVANAKNCVIRGNTIESPCGKPMPVQAEDALKANAYAIQTTVSSNVMIEKNVITKMGADCRGDVKRDE
ncbi:MAG: right-handed parallel beta-helix repeat-containing protein [Spirochaetota bacterium]